MSTKAQEEARQMLVPQTLGVRDSRVILSKWSGKGLGHLLLTGAGRGMVARGGVDFSLLARYHRAIRGEGVMG